jgi:hypothetical protein
MSLPENTKGAGQLAGAAVGIIGAGRRGEAGRVPDQRAAPRSQAEVPPADKLRVASDVRLPKC